MRNNDVRESEIASGEDEPVTAVDQTISDDINGSKKENERNGNLQILRFVAAALVLITHITFYIHERIDISVDVWHGGELGVPIFFVISGFVMFVSAEKVAGGLKAAKRFLQRRIVRIFPLLWLINTLKLLVAVVAPATIIHNFPDIQRVLCAYFLFPTLNETGEFVLLHGVAWTLLHEMFFYYLFATAILIRWSPLVFCSSTILILWVVGWFVPAESGVEKVFFSSLNLMFVAGMFLAFIYKKNIKVRKDFSIVLLLLGVSTLLLSSVGAVRREFIGDFPIEAIMIFIPIVSTGVRFPKKAEALLTKLGDSSYSLYMAHPILAPAVCLSLLKLKIQSIEIVLPTAFFVSVFVAYFIYKYIEGPMNSRFRKFLDNVLASRRFSKVGSQES